ncbi:amidohydrolase [Nocardiopsis sp. MG754419]|uniref:amidohydrolase family protein n=1 Tax=Nocardiopsis sp. MG754419 TaxID=2259865 RepID=UPI001BACB8E8|nr:amidohydrolase family protein [Nocardiopsis sp. MG754419]
MIIDTHLHTWDTHAFAISWLDAAGLPARSPIPDEDGPRGYVLVEADADDRHHETAWLLDLARADTRVLGVVASAALEEDGAPGEIDRLADREGVVGVRRLLQDRGLFDRPGLARGLRHLAERGLPFDACVRARELPALTALVAGLDGATVVLDHMGKPPVHDPAALRRWARDLGELAALPHVHCKLSGLPAEAGDATTLDAVTDEVVGHALTVFGAERCVVGGDRPVSRTRRDWCRRVLDLVPEDDRARVAHRNASALYRRRP